MALVSVGEQFSNLLFQFLTAKDTLKVAISMSFVCRCEGESDPCHNALAHYRIIIISARGSNSIPDAQRMCQVTSGRPELHGCLKLMDPGLYLPFIKW